MRKKFYCHYEGFEKSPWQSPNVIFLFTQENVSVLFLPARQKKIPKRTLLCYIKAELYVIGYTANYARRLAELCRKPPISTIHQGVAASVASLITFMAFCSFPRIDDSAILSRTAR